MKQVCLRPLFAAMDDTETEKQKVCKQHTAASLVTAIDRHMGAYTTVVSSFHSHPSACSACSPHLQNGRRI